MRPGGWPFSRVRKASRYPLMLVGASRFSAIDGSRFRSIAHDRVDELAQVRPYAAPRLERLTACVRDCVIATRRSGNRNFDTAGKETRCMQRAKHGIDRTLLQE